jgi:hypothetical protein
LSGRNSGGAARRLSAGDCFGTNWGADLGELPVTQAGQAGENIVIDAAGPATMAFEKLVALIRDAVGARAVILHVPPPVVGVAARALGLLVRDVVLTPDEIDGLMAGLLVSDEPPLGKISFSDWLNHSGGSVGSGYANELRPTSPPTDAATRRSRRARRYARGEFEDGIALAVRALSGAARPRASVEGRVSRGGVDATGRP